MTYTFLKQLSSVLNFIVTNFKEQFKNSDPKQSSECKISGFHGRNYEEWRLLGCYAVWLL
jgi:hypothetical protein